jgi:ribosomal protein S18 acetylase RimI-like enzyme
MTGQAVGRRYGHGGPVIIRPVHADELDAVARLIAAQQSRPERHIAYESMEPEAILVELRELEPAGLDTLLVAVDGEEVVGALALEWDTEPPRVWWHGPFVAGDDWAATADALLVHGRRHLPDTVTQEELAPDDRHAELAAWAPAHGFSPEEASAVLSRDLGELPDEPDVEHVDLRTFAEEDRAAVAAIHDELFPGTHLPGDRLDHGRDRVVVVAHHGDEVVGYAAAELQAEGDGYLGYLGVKHAVRGGGLGRLLVARTCRALAAAHRCPRIHLTVRESNAPARRLYARLGFAEERLIRPWRRGFSPG